ncbi:hypothetical protein [Rhizobium rhizogenes]|uniref:hypothetical protein n=1 Tax=Rhizobium rhizogenes TaxID=359 RepID=UPI00157382FC|nr:hypothetical protein [Rhizobium rhizogenes]NTF46618.1 hypothetical protein [Rhizobium rhizogenes]
MPQFNVTFSLNLSDNEANALADTLGCNPAQVGGNLNSYAKAALCEYLEMFTGLAVTGVADIRERRLAAILLALPAANFPTDERIARLFNLTTMQARGLLRSTLTKHRNRLKATLDAAARRFIAACQGAAGAEREARFPNAVIIEMLNAELAAAATPRAPIRRKPNTFDTYLVANGAFTELQARYP